MAPAADLDRVVKMALETARQAGAILMETFRRVERVESKGLVDLVTEADLASEEAIVDALRQAYPDHAILAEEGDYTQPAPSPHRWVVDPLDGTTNYVHGLPIFAVSIGYQEDGETLAGVVLNPAQGEEYVAVKRQGATLNGEPISVSGTDRLQESLLVTGFPYSHDEVFTGSFDLFRELYARCQGIRRLGAAALDFCYVAEGRFDAFYEANLKPWDVCAGELICREAGGQTSDWKGGAPPFSGRRILASNGTALHGEVLQVIADHYPGLR